MVAEVQRLPDGHAHEGKIGAPKVSTGLHEVVDNGFVPLPGRLYPADFALAVIKARNWSLT